MRLEREGNRNRDIPDCDFVLQWRTQGLVDLRFGRNPDDEAYFECEFFKKPHPPAIPVLSWTDSSGVEHVLKPTTGPPRDE